MADIITGIVKIVLTKRLPDSGTVGETYAVAGSAKIFGAVGSLPWVYAEVKLKKWYKPEPFEETVSFERGFPMPISGDFKIDFNIAEEGDYEVTLVATPAPLSLPVVGVFPIVGKSDVMKISVGKGPSGAFRFSSITIDGHSVPLADHDADSGLLLQKTTADYLDINPSFQWTGPAKEATISVKGGYRDSVGGFAPKTGPYAAAFSLPASPTPYSGKLGTPIRVPLTACGGFDDGAIEVVLKISDMADYISHVWNVYITKVGVKVIKVTSLVLS